MSATTEQFTPLNAYVGFDTITQQIEKKSLKRGFQLNVMVVGQTGLGKSTLINTLFASHLVDSKGRKSTEDYQHRQTTKIEAVSHNIEENGVRLRLNIIDTPGYGDQVNNDDCWEPIVKYIKDQHSAYLRKELTAQREKIIQDNRVHCCLYFITPSGHSLKPIDIIVLKKLVEVVNVIPVIAKADSQTPEERAAFKQRINQELADNKIHIYPYDNEEDYDDEERALNSRMRELLPFAVVGSEKQVVVDGRAYLGRQTRWGTVLVEDPDHCEFIHLRNFLTRTHLQDLIETTAMIHYETFRSNQLMAIKGATTAATSSSSVPSNNGSYNSPPANSNINNSSNIQSAIPPSSPVMSDHSAPPQSSAVSGTSSTGIPTKVFPPFA